MRARIVLPILLALGLSLGCHSEAPSPSASPSNDVIQVPKGIGTGGDHAKVKAPPLKPGAQPGTQQTAGRMVIPAGVPGAPKRP